MFARVNAFFFSDYCYKTYRFAVAGRLRILTENEQKLLKERVAEIFEQFGWATDQMIFREAVEIVLQSVGMPRYYVVVCS